MQVASHAQKFFLREALPPSRRDKKRASIHDIREACPADTPLESRQRLKLDLQQCNEADGAGSGGMQTSASPTTMLSPPGAPIAVVRHASNSRDTCVRCRLRTIRLPSAAAWWLSCTHARGSTSESVTDGVARRQHGGAGRAAQHARGRLAAARAALQPSAAATGRRFLGG